VLKKLIIFLFLGIVMLDSCKMATETWDTSQFPASSSYADQFDFLWNAFDKNYCFFAYKNIDWQALGATYRPRAIQASSQAQFAEVLTQMLSNLHDGHLYLMDSNDEQTQTYKNVNFINYSSGVWQQYMKLKVTNSTKPDKYVTSGWLEGVPYIAVSNWITTSQVIDLDNILECFKSAPGLIIDVRMNGGGWSSIADAFADRFADRSRTAGFCKYRDGPLHTDFGPLSIQMIAPRGSWQFTRPVFLLTGRRCASSTEGLISAMRELPNVTVIGDTSMGAIGNPKVFNLANGWKFSVSTGMEYTAEGQDIEDIGIAPDIFVPATKADFLAGKDPVLDYALARFKATIH